MFLLLDAARLVIDISMWLVVSRLVLALLVRRDSNPFWQAVVRATGPIYRVTRLIAGPRASEGWLGVLSLVGLGLARVPIALALRSGAP